MFSIREFIMKTIHGMVGYYPDFQVMEYALNWYGKGKITEEDLALVEEWLTPVEAETEEEEEGEGHRADEEEDSEVEPE